METKYQHLILYLYHLLLDYFRRFLFLNSLTSWAFICMQTYSSGSSFYDLVDFFFDFFTMNCFLPESWSKNVDYNK